MAMSADVYSGAAYAMAFFAAYVVFATPLHATAGYAVYCSLRITPALLCYARYAIRHTVER